MQDSKPILAYLEQLIAAGEELLKSEFKVATSSYTSVRYVPLDEFKRWYGNCRVLRLKLGSAFALWEEALAPEEPNTASVAIALLGTLRSVRDAVAGGHLVSYADIVLAEAFSDLLEQADYLKSKGYWLAAGTLGRAVLEEALRNHCKKAGCLPAKQRATLADYNTALYKASVYDKLEFKHIDSLIAIGNECAHNTGTATDERVKQLMEQLTTLLPRLKT